MLYAELVGMHVGPVAWMNAVVVALMSGSTCVTFGHSTPIRWAVIGWKKLLHEKGILEPLLFYENLAQTHTEF